MSNEFIKNRHYNMLSSVCKSGVSVVCMNSHLWHFQCDYFRGSVDHRRELGRSSLKSKTIKKPIILLLRHYRKCPRTSFVYHILSPKSSKRGWEGRPVEERFRIVDRRMVRPPAR